MKRALCMLALAACGTIYADPIQINTAVTADAGVVSSPPTPPFSCMFVPEEDGPCNVAGAVCEVGTSNDPDCNSLFECVVDETYGLYWTESRSPTCSDRACPAPTAIVDGAPCSVGDAGVDPDDAEMQCPGTNNALCGCTTGPDGAHAHPRTWVCVSPAADCPTTRPLDGAPCLGDHDCDYGACAFKRGSRMVCAESVWQIEAATCP